MFNGRKDILESEDFAGLHEARVLVQGDRQFVQLTFSLNPEKKYFSADEPQPTLVALSDGLSTRLFRVEPLDASLEPLASEPQSVDAPVAPEPASEPASASEPEPASEEPAEGEA